MVNTTASRRSGLFKFQVFDSMADEVFLTILSSMVQCIDNSSLNCLQCFCCDSPDRWNSHTLADGTVQVLFSNLLAVASAAFMITFSQHNLDKACRKYGVDIFELSDDRVEHTSRRSCMRRVQWAGSDLVLNSQSGNRRSAASTWRPPPRPFLLKQSGRLCELRQVRSEYRRWLTDF